MSRAVRDRAILFDDDSYKVIADCGQAIGIASADFYSDAFLNNEDGIDEAELLKQIGSARREAERRATDSIDGLRSALLRQFRVLMSADRP